jgi:CBS domain-containing protein
MLRAEYRVLDTTGQRDSKERSGSMLTVRQLLERKGHDVWSVEPHVSVLEAVREMSERNVGALMVCEGEELVGIVSERDIARKTILHGQPTQDTPVREIMTENVRYVRPDHNIDDCMALMTDKRIRHLPVLEEGRLVGIISIGDVVKATISEKENLIQQLETYITGGR